MVIIIVFLCGMLSLSLALGHIESVSLCIRNMHLSGFGKQG